MAGRRTNIALLGVLAIALITGALAYAFGVDSAALVVVAHGAAGLAVLLLAPWKSVIVRRGLARSRSGSRASVAFTVLMVASLLAGVSHSSGLAVSLGPVTAMQLHVGAALLAVPLLVWHVWRRPVRVARADLGRRNFLRAALVAAGGAVAYGFVELSTRVLSLPGADRRFTGSFERGSFEPDAMPVTQWLDDDVPQVSPDTWRLTLRMGNEVTELTLEDLDRGGTDVVATLDCTGGWFARQRWHGVRVSDLLGDVPGRSVYVRSATGYGRRFPLSDAEHLFVATAVGGAPLSPGHGAPARLVAPGRRGFWWVKWIESIEVSDRPWWAQSPFPLT